jgi:hypothetical protein
MIMFRITMVISTNDLPDLVKTLNERTRDGHIDRETRIDEDRWLLSIAVSDREEAQFLRTLTPWPNEISP